MNNISDEFLSLLAHELRTPVAAIIGYHDLMNEGILGEVDPRIAESLERIRSSANQLLALVASLGETAVDNVANLHVEIDDEDPREIVDNVLLALEAEARGRSTNVHVQSKPASRVFRTDVERVQRALLLTLHAAIKNTAGGAIIVNTNADNDVFTCTIEGARLDPVRDRIDNGTASVTTAAAMRLAMAAQAVRPLGGTIMLQGSAETPLLVIEVPETD
jgi:signal transduction histidine kinase